MLVRGVHRGRQHRGAAGRVDVDHPHAEVGSRRNRARDRVGNVVEFQVEEHAVAALDERPDDVRAGGREELAADLESADVAAKAIGERERLRGARDVEGDEDRP